MAKWKVGDIVQHKSTGDTLMILHVKGDGSWESKTDIQYYIVRLPNYQTAELREFELEMVPVSTKICDTRD